MEYKNCQKCDVKLTKEDHEWFFVYWHFNLKKYQKDEELLGKPPIITLDGTPFCSNQCLLDWLKEQELVEKVSIEDAE